MITYDKIINSLVSSGLIKSVKPTSLYSNKDQYILDIVTISGNGQIFPGPIIDPWNTKHGEIGWAKRYLYLSFTNISDAEEVRFVLRLIKYRSRINIVSNGERYTIKIYVQNFNCFNLERLSGLTYG